MDKPRQFAWTKETKREKAALTTAVAQAIVALERAASSDKVARLKALREAREGQPSS